MTLQPVFQEVLPAIDKFAPTIAVAIAGPTGLVIKFIVPLLAKAFNSDVHNISDIIKRIGTDENSADKLQELENKHGEFIKELLAQMTHLDSAELNVKIQWRN